MSMGEPEPPDGITRQRDTLARAEWTTTKQIHVNDKEIRAGDQPFGHYGEIADFVVQDPGTGQGVYVQGVDFPLTREMIDTLIAGLQALKERCPDG